MFSRSADAYAWYANAEIELADPAFTSEVPYKLSEGDFESEGE